MPKKSTFSDSEPNIFSFNEIEKKWQRRWEEAKVFEAVPDKRNKFYLLEMYPYPSASGLHMGHAFNYTIGDILARFKRMKGFNVLHPMGYDSFGLPAENAAIKSNSHPKTFTDEAIINFIRQQKALGLSYDWTRRLQSHDPAYYRWNQFLFLQLYKKGLVYRKESPVNWCPLCKTVLANEQVQDGKCWRHSTTDVEVKNLEQWFIKTTEYAEELLEGIEKLDWPERIKIMQRNWIGRSEGTEIIFKINGKNWPIFTTRPDTIFGVTFLVVSARHPRLFDIVSKDKKKEAEEFVKRVKSTKQEDIDRLDKEGVFTGSYAEHPLTGEKIPVWAGNFVLAEYGSGMVMAVPAHDDRDLEFAKKYSISIKEVVRPLEGVPRENAEFRKTISAVVQRKSDGKFLLVKWNKFGWVAPVIGGIEEGEDIGKAAEREIFEETGYKTKFVKKLGGEIESYFFAENKNVWRHRLDQPVLLELIDNTQAEIQKEEKDRQEAIWVNGEEAIKKITHSYNAQGILRHLGKERAYTGNGIIINSEGFDGLFSEEAKDHIVIALNKEGLGKKTVNYKLRDWLISRQRYWGTPIPMLYCEKCGVVPVSEKDLPILLPEKVKFGEGNPLATSKDFVESTCPECKGKAKRETDTMDTFFDSSWYYLRFTDATNEKEPFDRKKAAYWMPVDFYTGGAEHACMHLIYGRFFSKALRDLGYVSYDEPFKKLFNQGMVHGEDGVVMSKSRGNVVDPLEVSNKYGADALRLFLVSMASPDKDSVWSSAGIEGAAKFMLRFMNYFNKVKIGKSSKKTEHKINLAIREISREIDNLRYNFAIIQLRSLVESLDEEISKKDLESLIKLFAPLCPHVAEELWEKIGGKGFVSLATWPEVDESKIDDKIEQLEKAVDKTASDILNVLKIIKEKQGREANKVYLYVLPNEKEGYNGEVIGRRVGKEVKIFAVNDKNKHDPEGKAGKAKPGKPGIYVE